MKTRLSTLVLILCFGYITKAQNLVPNGYFEVYDTCPNNQFQITYATNWLNAGGTPDYFNACANISCGFNVPNTGMDYQKDCCNGNGYSGIYASAASGDNTAREYIQVKLNNNLILGHKYLASMYVNRSRSQGWAIATLGMFFSDSIIPVPPSLDHFINVLNPQVKNTDIISDTTSWVLVQDTFIANGNEKYVVIGNFSTDSLSDSLKIITPGAYYFQSYYYIDGVSLYDVTNSVCNSYWDASFDKYINLGDSTRLGAINTDNSTYIWQNSTSGNTYLSSNTSANPWARPLQTTTYYVTKTCPNNNIFKDTVTIYVYIKPNVNLGKDSVYCGIPNLPIILDAGSGQNYTYHWSTGAATQTISVFNSGTYSVTVSSATASLSATALYSVTNDAVTLLLLNPNNPNILHDTDLCNSNQFPITLDASLPVVSGTNNLYTWVGGQVGSQLTVNSAGSYVVTVWIRSFNNTLICKVTDTAIVTVGCLGIEGFINSTSINIYPNPSNGTMFIDYNVQENAQLEITDITGHLVGTYNMPLVNTQLQIKNSELPSGIYFYRVMCKDTVVKLGKIVIIK